LRKNRFLELFLERPRAEITRTFQGLPWDSWKYLLSEVAKMDFGCDFREGKCIAARLPGFTGQAFPPSTRRCCCVHCGKMIGYLTSIPKNDLPLLAMYFSPKYGFWRGNYGCVLPPENRSNVCLRFTCLSARRNRPNLSPWHSYLLSWLRNTEEPASRYRAWFKERYFTTEIGDYQLGNFKRFLEIDFPEWRMAPHQEVVNAW